MTTVELLPMVDEGLGNTAYLVGLGDSRALAVDVSLDLRRARREADRHGLTLTFVAETHLHADFVSGARQLAAVDGSQVLASAAGGRRFDHTELRDGDEIDLGGLRLRALATPGHTHEHLAYLLLDGDRPLGVFTGGSLLVGSAARTDLVSPDQTVALARMQYASLRRLTALPDDLAVWPTHGAGSFCSAPSGGERTTTIGHEKATNPLLQADDEDTFVTRLIDSLGSYPPYFDRLGEVNRRGPDVLVANPALPRLGVDDVAALRDDGAWVVDARPVTGFASGHIPGAVSIPLRPAFASWLGWLVPPDQPVVIVRDPAQDRAELAVQATKIGYDNLVGELADGITSWTAAGQPITQTSIHAPADLPDHPVLDIRQSVEFAAGHLPGAHHVELGTLPEHLDRLPTGPMVVMCGHGERAMGAASLLERAGRDDISVLVGGPDDWANHTGGSLEAS